MPGRSYNDDDTRGAGHTLAAVLRGLGHGALIAAAAMGIAAIGDFASVGLGSIATAGVVGMGCLLAADAVRDNTILANAERRHRREDEQDRDNERVDALVRARWSPSRRSQGMSSSSPASGSSKPRVQAGACENARPRRWGNSSRSRCSYIGIARARGIDCDGVDYRRAMIGTSHLATFGLLLLGASAAAGVGLTVGAFLCKEAGRNRDGEGSGGTPAGRGAHPRDGHAGRA